MSNEPVQATVARVSTLVPIEGRGTIGTLRSLTDIILKPGLFKIPEQNTCVYLGPRSMIKTNLTFQSFFDQNHAVAGWFMPQYPRGGHGPLFASPGPQRYFVGQGNYRSGNVVSSASNLAPGVAATAGDPVLTVHVGSASRIYLAPAWQAGTWQHLTVVRAGNVISLYLNGTKLQPVTVMANKNANGQLLSKTVTQASDLQVPVSVKGSSLGKVILGRSQHPTVTGYAQAYGLLDDVAVLDHTLTTSEIAGLIAKKRLSASETGLLAGWGFDNPAAGSLLPSKLNGSVDKQNVGPYLNVGSDRKSGTDKWLLDNPFVIINNTPAIRFPFPKGEAWKVSQGYCDPVSSHNGDNAAFCFDLTKVGGGSGNAPMFACHGGFVVSYLRNGTVEEREAQPGHSVQRSDRYRRQLSASQGQLANRSCRRWRCGTRQPGHDNHALAGQTTLRTQWRETRTRRPSREAPPSWREKNVCRRSCRRDRPDNNSDGLQRRRSEEPE